MFDVELYVHEIDRARQEHELEALSVGLTYFDRDSKGAINASECPELSARLFDLLDANKDGSISHDDLLHSVKSIIHALDDTMERIRQLQREIDELREKRAAGQAADSISVHIAQNEATIEEKRREVRERERDLRAIFSHTTGTHHTANCRLPLRHLSCCGCCWLTRLSWCPSVVCRLLPHRLRCSRVQCEWLEGGGEVVRTQSAAETVGAVGEGGRHGSATDRRDRITSETPGERTVVDTAVAVAASTTHAASPDTPARAA